MRIGDFEAAVRAADPEQELDTFSLCGKVFTVSPDVNIVALGRFARVARAGGDTDDMEGLAALIDTVASLVIDEDQNRLLDVASKNRVDVDLLLRIVGAVYEAGSGRPTVQPTDSSDGLSTTGQSSRVHSSSVASSTPRPAGWRDTPFGRRELAAHPELYEDLGSVSENGARLASVG